jgi:hypothetical protein
MLISNYLRRTRSNTVRFMSVINLSTDDAVEKFRLINSKSVLYFTAQVGVVYGRGFIDRLFGT